MLDENNIINKIIIDNYKINEEDKENEIKNETNDINIFKQLFDLQLLIQKHSGLKELCK
jgi:hypothetical protein